MGAKRIDPIVVREERARLDGVRRTMELGTTAADALLWFHEYAAADKVEDAVMVHAAVVASATPNAKVAQSYLTAAARPFAQQILNRAIEAAQEDAHRAEQLRRDAEETARRRRRGA